MLVGVFNRIHIYLLCMLTMFVFMVLFILYPNDTLAGLVQLQSGTGGP